MGRKTVFGLATVAMLGALGSLYQSQKQVAQNAFLQRFPEEYRTEATFTPQGVRDLFENRCLARDFQNLGNAHKYFIGGLTQETIEDAWLSVCGPLSDTLEKKIQSAKPPIEALWTRPEEWNEETRELVGNYNQLVDMDLYKTGVGGRYSGILQALSSGVSRNVEIGQIPIFTNADDGTVHTLFTHNVVDLIEANPAILNSDVTYTSVLRLLQAKAKGYIACINDNPSGNTGRALGCSNALDNMRRTVVMIQDHRENMDLSVYSLSPFSYTSGMKGFADANLDIADLR